MFSFTGAQETHGALVPPPGASYQAQIGICHSSPIFWFSEDGFDMFSSRAEITVQVKIEPPENRQKP